MAESSAAWSAIADLVDVVERDDATAAREVGPLFRRAFGDELPDFPRHFVLRYVAGGRPVPLGYYHVTPWEGCYLAGGMVFDERVYRRLPPEHRARIRASGGAMEFLTRRTHAMLTDALAVFGHVGDPRAERIDLRAGYVHTAFPRDGVLAAFAASCRARGAGRPRRCARPLLNPGVRHGV
ncbi:MAG: hypothetical protein IPI87_00790 [Betaproteobacteria bacterium]|nr:hypothetical protein [Betaproteobacteria bacterium]